MLCRTISLILACILAISAGGCAYSPQQLRPVPRVTEAVGNEGGGRPVNIRVIDERSSPVLGSRGGVYSKTSTVSVSSEQIVSVLQEEADRILRLMDYTPTPYPENAARLTLYLSSLDYRVSGNRKAAVTTVFRVEVTNAERSFGGQYNAFLERGFTLPLNQEKNTKLVEHSLADAMTRMFKDPDLNRILGKP